MAWAHEIPKLIVVLIGMYPLSHVTRRPIEWLAYTSSKLITLATSPRPSETCRTSNIWSSTICRISQVQFHPSSGKLSKLTFLRISQTNISGPVLEYLSKFWYNNLDGTISPSLSQLSNLEFLRLDRNKLIGIILESLGKLAGKHTHLYLGLNQLTGVVPTSFAGWSFDNIDLSRNMLEGDISFLFGKDKTIFERIFRS